MPKGPKRPVIESYLFEIEQVRPSYTFHVGYERWEVGAFGEHLHIELTAKCIHPHKFAGRETTFIFIGRREIQSQLEASAPDDFRPNGVGTLTFRGARSEYLGSLPYDAASILPATIHTGGFRFVRLDGPALNRGTSAIQAVAFEWEFDPDNY